ncbi:hypothetical protein [Nostoc sp. ChiQUE01b]|uniref:hypothetical protein n=1 Tax=Nostoc sp. ChiQUE01b TaxID=3075376 RepID=UPI002AD4C064|nr:hypothetical protein [Nostoc sp. ChiQUE01b]MDZ8260590.1 hypothetical protein [Nostoc sp. ChiQUE01b]
MTKITSPTKREILEQEILSVFRTFDSNASPLLVKEIAECAINFFYDPDKAIAIVWSIEDINAIREDLNDEQAFMVLEDAYNNYVEDSPITWKVLKFVADDLFPREEAEET